MIEREIIAVTAIEETEWDNDTWCMSATSTGASDCSNIATKEIKLEYDNEPGKRFYTCLCAECTAEYVRKWDKAKIFGDQKI